MWRTTPMHRDEVQGSSAADAPPSLSAAVDQSEIQRPEDGAGPLFHRRYRTTIRDSHLTAADLVHEVSADPDTVAPSEFASFQKVRGERGRMAVADEYVVRMPGPWDGPVRVVESADERQIVRHEVPSDDEIAERPGEHHLATRRCPVVPTAGGSHLGWTFA